LSLTQPGHAVALAKAEDWAKGDVFQRSRIGGKPNARATGKEGFYGWALGGAGRSFSPTLPVGTCGLLVHQRGKEDFLLAFIHRGGGL